MMTIRILAPSAALALAGVLASAPSALADAAGATAKVSIVQAIEAAETKAGGKATEADFEDGHGGRWEVKALSASGDRLVEYYVDPNSGQVTGEEEQTFEKYFTTLKPEDFSKAQTQLKDAVAAAEAFAKGKATGAEVEREGDTVAYEIDVRTTDGDRDVRVDAMGKATAD